MALYGSKEYRIEEKAKAEARLELMTYAFVRKLAYLKGESHEAEKLVAFCKVYVDAYEEAQEARRRYDECVRDEAAAEESTEV